MAKPDVKYKVKDSAGTELVNNKNFYEAINYVRVNTSAKTVYDANNNLIFTKDGNSNNYHVYQYNYPNGNASGNPVTKNATDALSWVKQYANSRAINGKGEHGNSNTKIFFKHNYVQSDDEVYSHQEKNVGGYYTCKSLAAVTHEQAQMTVDLNSPRIYWGGSTGGTVGYIAMGVKTNLSPSWEVEFGLMLRSDPSNSQKQIFTAYYRTASDPTLIPMCLENQTTGDGYVCDMGSSTNTTNGDAIFEMNLGTTITMKIKAKGKTFYKAFTPSGIKVGTTTFGLRRFVSFCPTTDAGPMANLNKDHYFKSITIKDSKLKRSGQTYNWTYNQADNTQFSAAFNTEFIDTTVSASSETVNISYKSRDANGKLIIT